MDIENLTDEGEHDLYIAQLRDVFECCDETGSGKLNRSELQELCDKLQLEDQSEFLINELLVDTEEVEFDLFKESFINILSKTGIVIQSSEDEDQEEDKELITYEESEEQGKSLNEEGQGQILKGEDKGEDIHEDRANTSEESESSIKREMSPKYVVGKKRYGRRSMPFVLEDIDSCLADDEDDIEVASSTMSLKHSLIIHDMSDTEEDGSECKRRRRTRDCVDSESDDDLSETFEAEGQIDHLMADSENLMEEERYLRDIWKNLGVGKNGYIDMKDLGKVCTYIGMDEMTQTKLHQLFNKLDADRDGKVSFQEFLNELFQHDIPTHQRKTASTHTEKTTSTHPEKTTPTHPGKVTPRSVGATSTRALSAQKKFKILSVDERVTPSIVQGSGAAGLFSVLDPEGTGFAKADEIIDLWENYNVTNGADVLIGLGFDLTSKINLSELSAGLEEELISMDEANLVYQAATASFQQEIQHLKSSLEQATWAKEKFKLDLAESKARNSLLAEEVDERHSFIEKSSQAKLLSVEKKYQEQVKQLHADLDKDREKLSQFAAKQNQNIEADMEELKQEEGRLREQLQSTSTTLENIEHDLEDVTCQLDESTKQNQRLQREMEHVHDLHRKLAEYESKSLLSPGEQRFTQEKLQRLEQDNKDLKDQVDELTAELEYLKQEIVPSRKTGSTVELCDDDDNITKEGSFMSQYIKPVFLKKVSYVSPECSDDETRRQGSAQGRRLPSAPYEEDNIRIRLLKSALRSTTGINSTDEQETVELLQKQLKEMKDKFEDEKKEIEQTYKLEITATEERQDKDKELLLQHLHNEKVKIAQEFERLQQAALAELAQELQTKFDHEKEGLIRNQDNATQKHAEVIKKLSDKLKREYEEDGKKQTEELILKYEQEICQLKESLAKTEPFIAKLENQKLFLEQNLKNQTEDSDKALREQKMEMEDLLTKHIQRLEDVEKEKQELVINLNKQLNESDLLQRQDKIIQESVVGKLHLDIKELHQQRRKMELEFNERYDELEIAFRQEKQEINQLYEEKINELEEKERETKKQNEQMLKKGISNLTGKLKDDFYRLLKEATEQEANNAKAELVEDLKQQEKHLQEDFDTRKSELSHMFELEKYELVEKYEEEMNKLRQELNAIQNRLEKEREAFGQRLESEREAFGQRLESEREALGQRFESEREALGQRCESEKEAFEGVLAQQIREEIEEEICQQMEEIRDAYEEEKLVYETRTNLLKNEIEELQEELKREDKNRKKIEELGKANKSLQQEKRKIEKSQTELADKLESTKKALEARIDELLSEKEDAVLAVKGEFLESSKQEGKERDLYGEVLKEKTILEVQLSDVRNQNLNLQIKAEEAEELKKHLEHMKQENIERNREQSIPPHAQRAINELTQEKSELEERLVDRENRLAEMNETFTKYTHLQFDLGQMSIGQSALEETLLDTQDKLADMEAKYNQSEKELKDAQRYRDKYKFLQRKYEDVCKERDKISTLAKNLKEQLNKANSASKEEHQEKGNLTKVLEEKKRLEQQLQTVSDKLLEATTNFAVSQSQHIRQLQQWKDGASNMVDLEKYTKLQIDLVDNQRSLRDMHEIISSKEEISYKTYKENVEKHKDTVGTLESQKESLGHRLQTLQQVLDGQILKFTEQFEAAEKRNALVVDLYKENADLMDKLYKVETQKKDAVSRCYKLEDQCNHLRRMLKKIATVAVK